MSDGRVTWTPQQAALVRKLAGQWPATVIAQRVSKIGPPHTAGGVEKWAAHHRISLGITGRPSRRGHRREPAWSEAENAVIRALAGRRSDEEITAAVNALLMAERTVVATRRQVSRLGLPLARYDGIGIKVLVEALSIDWVRIWREVDAGRLRAERHGGGKGGSVGSYWLFLPADIEAWIKAYPYAIDWRRVTDERWRNLARAAYLRDPHLSVAEAATHLGVVKSTLNHWVKIGKIDGVKNIGTPRKPTYRIPLRALDQIERLARKGAA